jgi:DNA-directed RNA polymerase II subunit RPB2
MYNKMSLIWTVLDSYFSSDKYFLTKHHLTSYNDFVSNKILTTIHALNPIITIKETPDVKHEINIYIGGPDSHKIYINKPTIVQDGQQRLLYPNEARLKDITYQSEIYADIYIKYISKEVGKEEKIYEKTFNNIKIGAIPIMLHSKLCVLNNQPKEVLREMGECIYDQGGYFIVEGKEKVIVAQERIATNRIFINKSKDDKYSYHGLIRCTSQENPLFPKTINIYVYSDKPVKKHKKSDDSSSDVEDSPDETERVPNAILLEIPYLTRPIPLFALFRALGIESDKDILSHIVYDIEDPINKEILDFVRASLIHGNNRFTQREVLTYLTNLNSYKHIDKLRDILTNDLFPNVGQSFKRKAVFLGYIVNELVKVCLGAKKESDRDSYIFKRVDISGFLIGNLFRDYYNQFKNKIRNKVDNEYFFGPLRGAKDISNLVNVNNIPNIFKYDIIENGMRKSLKGSWGISETNKDIKQGLVQDLSRFSYIGSMSHLRRVNTPMDPTAKIVAPHRLHPSQWGIMCPCESPDGASIGLLKNLAIMCHITFDTNVNNVLNCLKDHNLIDIQNASFDELNLYTKIFVNNNWVGIHKDAPTLYEKLKLLKRNSRLHIFTSIAWDIINTKINIQTEAGRCCRPLFVVENGKLLIDSFKGDIKWNDLINNTNKDVYTNSDDLVNLKKTQAVIEFVDVEESNTLYIAMTQEEITKKHTHCEIHPSTIFSILTHQIPLVNHNQAPRCVFSGAQGKQAIGLYATNFANRIDTMSYILHYPQRSLVTTRYKEYLHNNAMPNGENLIVAIATYSGYNMEDSIIFNKAAIDRGCFNITYYKNLMELEEGVKDDNEYIRFGNPVVLSKVKEVQNIKSANYTNLDENGFPLENTFIKEGDAYIGKTKIKSELVENTTDNIFGNKVKKELYYDKSSIANKTLSGTVDKVFVYTTDQSLKVCKIRLRKIRTPELGDKLCSTIAQKGVIGMILPQEDMPFTKDGMIPDIIINPHAIPSRMTVGQLLECVLGKAAACMGTIVDATPFNNYNYEDIINKLETDYKYERNANEVLYSGYYGCQLSCDIFMGPTYYQRLKHMVADKMNYRKVDFMSVNNGIKTHTLKAAPYEFLTRQPTHGRGSEGGLRIGNMELDSMQSHGVLQFINESMMERSDAFEFELDNKTHSILSRQDAQDVSILRTPYTFKLMTQEIMAMNIKPNIITYDTIDSDSDI